MKRGMFLLIFCIVLIFALFFGCASGPSNSTRITDLSVVPAISDAATQLEGTWRFTGKNGWVTEYTFFGNQFINSTASGNKSYLLSTRGTININGSTIELYNTNRWEDLRNVGFYQILQKRDNSIGIWKPLPDRIFGNATKVVYTFSIENNQFNITDGKNTTAFTKENSQAVVLDEINPSILADVYGLTLRENESVVIVQRQSASEARKSRNSRINNDFEIRINGNKATTIGNTASGIQMDSIFGTDTITAFVVPNGNHTLDIFGTANRRDYQSNAVQFTAQSSVVSFSAVWKGTMVPNLIVEKVEELVFDEGLDKMVIRRFN